MALFIVLSVLAFATLFFLIVRTDARIWSAKMSLYFYFFLYVALVYTRFRWPEMPWELVWYFNTLLAAGILWFWTLYLIPIHRKRNALKNNLKQLKKNEGPLFEIVMACRLLQQAKQGALMIYERKSSLDAWYEKGIRIQSYLTREILFSLFTPPGALHDGAVLMRDHQVVSAAVIVPLTRAENFSTDLGTRHRAALGFSEISDALCMVVSEETGTVSFADRGNLYYDIPIEKLSTALQMALRYRMKDFIKHQNQKNPSKTQVFEQTPPKK